MQVNKKKGNNRNNYNSKENLWKTIAITLIGFIVGFALGMVLDRFVFNTKDTTSNTTSGVTSTTPGVEENPIVEIEITDKELVDKAIYEINDKLSFLDEQSVFLSVQISENEYDGYLYNSKGEILAQADNASYTAVFTNDGRSIRYDSSDGTVSIDSAIDVLTTIHNAVDGLTSGKSGFSLKKIELADKDKAATDSVTEYVIDVSGEEAFLAVYSSVSDEFATKLKDALTSTMEGWEPHLEFGFVFDDENNINMYCNIVTDEGTYSNWVCTGYRMIQDWVLDEEWYNTEFSEANADKLYAMVTSLVDAVSSLINDEDVSQYEVTESDTSENDTSDIQGEESMSEDIAS